MYLDRRPNYAHSGVASPKKENYKKSLVLVDCFHTLLMLRCYSNPRQMNNNKGQWLHYLSHSQLMWSQHHQQGGYSTQSPWSKHQKKAFSSQWISESTNIYINNKKYTSSGTSHIIIIKIPRTASIFNSPLPSISYYASWRRNPSTRREIYKSHHSMEAKGIPIQSFILFFKASNRQNNNNTIYLPYTSISKGGRIFITYQLKKPLS